MTSPGPAKSLRWISLRAAALPLAAAAAVMAAGASARAAECEALAARAVPGVRLTSAARVQAGPMSVPAPEWGAPPVTVTLPAYCRVIGTAGGAVGFELWLPERGWNGRLLSVGSGGFGGSVRPDGLAEGLLAGYAVTANDTGHQGDDRGWMRRRDRVRAWGHSASHDVTGPAKALVAAYYGRPARYAYFTGCSTGGAQAMDEAEFYPADYDGIVAGAPGMSYAHLMLSFLWGLKAASAHPDSLIPPEKLTVLHRAVIDACAGPSGRRLGIVEDPQACHFDPARLQCAEGDRADCLTPHQVETARLLYQGPRNPRTGAQIYPGFAYGSEAADPAEGGPPLAYGWTGIQGALAQAFAIPLMRDMVYQDPSWDWRTFDWDRDVDVVDQRVATDITAIDPDLQAFAAHGGKLILYQGWGDPLNGQSLPIDYRAAVIDQIQHARGIGREAATRETDGFLRLFMAPGMAHCVGGPGPSRFDALSAVRDWVEQGRAPERLIATRPARPELGATFAAPVVRPICRFPKIARWNGEGGADRAEQFTCAAPVQHPPKPSVAPAG